MDHQQMNHNKVQNLNNQDQQKRAEVKTIQTAQNQSLSPIYSSTVDE